MPFNMRCVGLMCLELRGVGQRCKFTSYLYISIDCNRNMEIICGKNIE